MKAAVNHASATQSSRAGWRYKEGNSSFSGPTPQSLGVSAALFCDQARSNWDSVTSATQFHCPKLYTSNTTAGHVTSLLVRQECERQKCERHQCELRPTVRMPTVRKGQQCEETRVRMSIVRMPAVRCDIGAKKSATYSSANDNSAKTTLCREMLYRQKSEFWDRQSHFSPLM